MSVRLLSYSKDYMETLLTAIGQCHGKTVGAKALESVIDSGHLSVLEHAMASFEVQCSLSVLGQITRHRHLSFTVKSTRVAVFEEYYVPENVVGSQRLDFMIYAGNAIVGYNMATKSGMSRESAAYLLPKATMTSMVVSGNLRAWFEYLPKRECLRALAEHRVIAERIHSELTVVMPEIFGRELKKCNVCAETSCEFGGKL